MNKLLVLTIIFSIISFSNGAPKCTSSSCASLNTKCTNYYCNSQAGCYGIEKCQPIDACHYPTCNSTTGNCTQHQMNCDDGNPCTDDFCNVGYGCYSVGNDCDPAVICQKNCNDGNPCTDDYCDYYNTCQHSLTNCIDHDECTLDSCGPNGCIFTNISCNDNDPCTADYCSNLYGCYHQPIECSIKVPCTTTSACNRNNLCEDYTCDLSTHTCKYTAKYCGGWPCINNQCMTGYITN
ncbi:hypothetical protein RB653_005588 [Dictyostelium firmibasis]|uniref:Uncharacterized protein n=1 Tax=Dictyostelium firmibasis TaxID=79012 RepID=A0AAN7U877_9MYCE